MGQREEVLDYIRNSKPQCDDCIAERLNYSHRQVVNMYARLHCTDGKVKRYKGVCALCKSNKLVNEAVIG